MSLESLCPVTDGNRSRDPQPSTELNLGTPVEEREKVLYEPGIITKEPTEAIGLLMGVHRLRINDKKACMGQALTFCICVTVV